MDINLKYEERVVFALRSLYSKYGYSQYKMKKFEEYDLYANNKDFLISDSVITFTDTNGKLMALKPDVTLSIVKNSKETEGYVEKLYYNENVYRVSKNSKSFKEIMQVGLECIGDIDSYSIAEAITLAALSLKEISADSVLCLSQLDVLYALLDSAGVGSENKSKVIKCIESKNSHELKELLSAEAFGLINKTLSVCGNAEAVLPKLESICKDSKYLTALQKLSDILSLLDSSVKEMLQIDFSVVSDVNYYNGIVFKGFIEKIPSAILSGGQYDALMQKMSKRSGAIGFAVYLDMLDPLKTDESEFEQDTVILYDQATDKKALKELADKLISEGNRVCVQRNIPAKLTYRQLITLRNGEVEVIEKNA